MCLENVGDGERTEEVLPHPIFSYKGTVLDKRYGIFLCFEVNVAHLNGLMYPRVLHTISQNNKKDQEAKV